MPRDRLEHSIRPLESLRSQPSQCYCGPRRIFKMINDHLGPMPGDLIVEVARSLRAQPARRRHCGQHRRGRVRDRPRREGLDEATRWATSAQSARDPIVVNARGSSFARDRDRDNDEEPLMSTSCCVVPTAPCSRKSRGRDRLSCSSPSCQAEATTRRCQAISDFALAKGELTLTIAVLDLATQTIE